VRLTHPDRVFYPDQGITKLALAQYYAAIQDWALPHLANRPLSLVRCPEGQGGECFYQKHVSSGVPDVVGRVEIRDKSGSETYLVIENLAGLVAMVQMGVLEIHPWGSTVAKLETPDIITFDFDPDVGLPWQRVTDAAIEMREALLGIGLQSFAKTTGGKGLHVVVPIAPKLPWPEVKEFSHLIAQFLVRAEPSHFTAKVAKERRRRKVFVDYLRNSETASAVSAFSARARPNAGVSTPLAWDELSEKDDVRGRYTVQTVPQRLATLKEDPWAGYAATRQSIGAAMWPALGKK